MLFRSTTLSLIAKHQQIINELNAIKDRVVKNIDEKVTFCVHTRELFRSWEPYVRKHKDHIDVSPETMYTILNGAIEKERERINKLINMEIERELERRSKEK